MTTEEQGKKEVSEDASARLDRIKNDEETRKQVAWLVEKTKARLLAQCNGRPAPVCLRALVGALCDVAKHIGLDRAHLDNLYLAVVDGEIPYDAPPEKAAP